MGFVVIMIIFAPEIAALRTQLPWGSKIHSTADGDMIVTMKGAVLDPAPMRVAADIVMGMLARHPR